MDNGGLRKTFRTAAIVLLPLVIIPVASEFFIELARELGVYDHPSERVASVSSFLAEITAHSWFPWIGGMIFGFALGTWTDWLLRRQERRREEQEAEERRALANALISAPRKKESHPIFGAPRQLGDSPYLSWWHIPVTLEPGSEPIQHCTIEWVPASIMGIEHGLSIHLRWQSADSPMAIEETTLLEDRERLIPLAVRCEKSAPSESVVPADGVARVTGGAFFRDKKIDKFRLGRRTEVRLRIRSGSKTWESPHVYILKAPPEPDDSNGTFVLEQANPRLSGSF